MYFNSFPLTNYTLGGKTEQILDIFRRVAIIKEKTSAYFEVIVTDEDTIETLAEKYYNDANLSWIIALTNDIIDPLNEFPKSRMTLTELYSSVYSDDILYFEENINLQPGDILIGVDTATSLQTLPSELLDTDLDTTKYCFVSEYNNEFRYAKITNSSYNINISDLFAAYRRINNSLNLISFNKSFATGQANQEACILTVLNKTSYLNSPVYLYNSSTSAIVSPYQKWQFINSIPKIINDYVDLEATGAFSNLQDDNAFRRSILYRYLMQQMQQLPVENLSVLTKKQDIENKNEKFRKIKILPIDVIPKFLDVFTELMTKRDTRSRLISIKD